MKYFYGIVLVFLVYSIVSGMSVNLFNPTQGKEASMIFSVNDNVYNHRLSYWSVEWLNYFLTIKNIENGKNVSLAHPRDHYSPEKCLWNQNKSSPFFNLPDHSNQADLSSVQIRDCTVPAGKALLVQIVGSNCSPNEGYKTDAALLQCAKWVLPEGHIKAAIDGKEVINTDKNPSDKVNFYLTPFITDLTYGPGNYYGDPSGKVRGAAAGYFLAVKPLSLGDHTITYTESVINALDSTGNDRRLGVVQYNIHVKNMTQQ